MELSWVPGYVLKHSRQASGVFVDVILGHCWPRIFRRRLVSRPGREVRIDLGSDVKMFHNTLP